MSKHTFPLLRLLADGEFHSGETMASALDISRASVWNAVHALQEQGIVIFKVRGRGYKLAEPFELLDASKIKQHLDAPGLFSVEVFQECESTNSHLMDAGETAASGRVIATERQTAGRGRRGRVWQSLPGGSLTFSLAWRFQRGSGFLSGLSLAVGLACVRALERIGLPGVQLKWPNDLLWQGRKLGGILVEMKGDTLGPSLAVVGIGLNVRLPEAVRDAIDQPAADLAELAALNGDALVDRNAILGALLNELNIMLREFEQAGFAPLRGAWSQYDAYQGKAVRVLEEARSRANPVAEGIVVGIDVDGALLVETPRCIARVLSGDVSLRRSG